MCNFVKKSMKKMQKDHSNDLKDRGVYNDNFAYSLSLLHQSTIILA